MNNKGRIRELFDESLRTDLISFLWVRLFRSVPENIYL